MKESANLGVTRLVSAGGDWGILPILGEWEKAGKLITRFSISEFGMPGKVDEAFLQRMTNGRSRYQSQWVRTGAIKFGADGVIESHTAYLPQGYADDPAQKGTRFWNPADLNAAVTKLAQRGFQIYVHAIGDGGIKQTLDAFEAAAAAGAPTELRHRIEHYEAPYGPDIARLAKLNVIASIQPLMIYPKDQWMGMEGLWERYAGSDRTSRAFPLRSVLDSGGRIALGTDWQVVDLNPLLGIRNAVVRRSIDGEPTTGWSPKQRITIDEAIKGYTLDAAYAAHREHEEGSLTPGKLADFVIMSDDLTQMDPRRIHEARVIATYVSGVPVYQEK